MLSGQHVSITRQRQKLGAVQLWTLKMSFSTRTAQQEGLGN